MIVRICPKCKTKEIISELKNRKDIDLKVECIQFCGVGRDKYVAIVNHVPIIKNTKEELLKEIILKKN